jgi:hypothetical protein
VTPPAASQGATGYTLGGVSVGDVSPIGAQRVIYRTPTGTNAFDGRWSVVIHTRAGSCGAEYRYGVQIINGNITTDAGDSTGVSGHVLRNGAVSVSVSAGGAYARLRTAVVRGAVNPLASPAPACGRLLGADSEAAKRLGVRYVLEGSVRKNGNASGSRRS